MPNENIISEKDVNNFYLHDDYLGNRKHSNRKPKISVLLIPENYNNIPSVKSDDNPDFSYNHLV